MLSALGELRSFSQASVPGSLTGGLAFTPILLYQHHSLAESSPPRSESQGPGGWQVVEEGNTFPGQLQPAANAAVPGARQGPCGPPSPLHSLELCYLLGFVIFSLHLGVKVLVCVREQIALWHK